MTTTRTVQQSLAPTGYLRAVINLGNPILARRADAAAPPTGVSVDLAQAVAQALGVALQLHVVHTAAEAVAAVREQVVDLGFFAIDPARSAGMAFTAPYVLIEGSFLVRHDAAWQHNDDIDRPGTRVVVGQGSAYDLYLSRHLQHAQLVRATSSPEVVPHFLAHGLDVAAGVKQQLQADLALYPGLRLLPGHFMVIQQALGLADTRGPQAHAWLCTWLESFKASGAVAHALQRHGIAGASVAPAYQA